MEYRVDDIVLSYEAEGERTIGPDEILLDKAIDLTEYCSWSQTGFTIQRLFTDAESSAFHTAVKELLTACWTTAGLLIPKDFNLTDYHTFAHDQARHLAAVEKTKLLSVDDFPLGISRIEKRISEICGVELEARNPFDDARIFHFRVVRPMSRDNNPLHRDVWLDDYDNCLNLYIPIVGSNKNSSLILFPGSHRWPESKIERTTGGAVMHGVRFNVPAVTGIQGDYTVVRPDPALNEVLIFSPYLIHGGSVNLNTDQTRISIELRLWKK